MMGDSINILDNNYTRVKVEKVRPLKTRTGSFNSILSSYRKKLLEKGLNSFENATLEEKYTDKYPYSVIKKKIDLRARIVAELEKKILILSKEDIPSNYVNSRAIKIRNAMMENLVFNSDSAYTKIGIENKDKVFGDFKTEPKEESFVNPADLYAVSPPIVEVPSENANDLNVIPTDSERKGIEEAISDSFNAVVDEQKSLMSEESNNNVNTFEGVNDVIEHAEPIISEDLTSTNLITPEEVSKVVGDINPVLDNVQDVTGSNIPNENSDDVDVDSIKNEIDRVLSHINVSRNMTHPAKLNNYSDIDEKENIFDSNAVENSDDSEKNVNSIENDDLTTSDIFDKISQVYDKIELNNEASKQNLQPDDASKFRLTVDIPSGKDIINHEVYDTLDASFVPDHIDNEVFVSSDDLVRDMPVVVPERSISTLGNEMVKPIENSDEDIEEFEFDESSNDVGTTMSPLSNDISAELYRMQKLKDQLSVLIQQQQLRAEKLKQTVQYASDVSEMASAVKSNVDSSIKNYQSKVNQLSQAISERTASNDELDREIELYAHDADMNKRFMEMQQSVADQYSQMADEIDNVLSGKKM